MTADDQEKLSPPDVATLYLAHSEELKRFLWGVLRSEHLVQDVIQNAFAKLADQGHKTQQESRKAWLFRVAYHEAMAIRRRETVGQRARQHWVDRRESRGSFGDDPLVHIESVEAVRRAIAKLPVAQQEIVRLRIYEEQTFAEISRQLGIPLGTALARMRSAMQKLRCSLDAEK